MLRWTPDTFWNSTWADFTDSVRAWIWYDRLSNGIKEHDGPNEEEERDMRKLMDGMTNG